MPIETSIPKQAVNGAAPTPDAGPAPAPAGMAATTDDRVKAVLAQLAKATNLDDKGQRELAGLVRALDEVVAQSTYAWLSDVEVAAALLLASPSQVAAASGIRADLEKRLGQRTPIAMLRRNSSVGNVALGLATPVVAVGVAIVVVALNIQEGTKLAGLDLTLLALVSVAGALGSVVSVLYRIDKVDNSSTTPLRQYFTGLFKPIIGVGFALFVFTALAAKLTALVQPPPGAEPYFYAALGFIAGFVEKFAPDLISKTETTLDGSASGTPASSGGK